MISKINNLFLKEPILPNFIQVKPLFNSINKFIIKVYASAAAV
jgi:hypothetical protein